VKTHLGSNQRWRMTPKFFNIRTPISLERLKLEISNLVCASTTRCNLDSMQKLGQRGRDLVYMT